MKALIRNTYETITENMGVSGIDWTTGAPLTASKWAGGPYVLVDDYPVNGESDPEFTPPAPSVDPEVPLDEPETVTIDGKQYTRAELLALLNQTN